VVPAGRRPFGGFRRVFACGIVICMLPAGLSKGLVMGYGCVVVALVFVLIFHHHL
jgi:hypothetical protein